MLVIVLDLVMGVQSRFRRKLLRFEVRLTLTMELGRSLPDAPSHTFADQRDGGSPMLAITNGESSGERDICIQTVPNTIGEYADTDNEEETTDEDENEEYYRAEYFRMSRIPECSMYNLPCTQRIISVSKSELLPDLYPSSCIESSVPCCVLDKESLPCCEHEPCPGPSLESSSAIRLRSNVGSQPGMHSRYRSGCHLRSRSGSRADSCLESHPGPSTGLRPGLRSCLSSLTGSVLWPFYVFHSAPSSHDYPSAVEVSSDD